MMLLALALQQTAVAAPPADWSSLPALPYRIAPVIAPQMTAYVGSEVKAGRCAQPRSVDGQYHVALDVAVLVAPDGAVRRAVPRAINCPTVEQYGAGLVTGLTRGNLQPLHATADQWYRATVTFDWQG